MSRHLASCIITQSIDMASQVHVFVVGMQENMMRYCLTLIEPKYMEDAFDLALREDYFVARRVGTQRRNHFGRLD